MPEIMRVSLSVPGAFSPSRMSQSQEEGLASSRLGVRAEITQSNPHLLFPSQHNQVNIITQ